MSMTLAAPGPFDGAGSRRAALGRLLGVCGFVAGCLNPPPPSVETPSLSATPVRPAPAAAWAGDRGCLASAQPKGDDKKGVDSADLIIRTVQRSDPSFQLLEMRVAVVGREPLAWAEGVRLQDAQQFVRVPGVAAGPHTLSTLHRLAGKGSGVDAYLAGYKYKVLSSHTFNIEPAQTTCVSVLLYFGDPQLPLGQRPSVDFREERAPLEHPQ